MLDFIEVWKYDLRSNLVFYLMFCCHRLLQPNTTALNSFFMAASFVRIRDDVGKHIRPYMEMFLRPLHSSKQSRAADCS